MLGDALSYPLDDDSWIRTILIGGLLSLLTVFVVPIFFLQGYYVRVLHGVTNDDPSPPEFSDWADLLIDGLKLFAVNLVVGLVVFLAMGIVAVIFGAGSLLSAGMGGDPGAAAGGIFAAFGAVGMLLFIAFALVLGYVAPGMFANFAREDSIAAAFDVSTVLAGVTTMEYLTGWVLAVLVAVVLGTIASFLSVILVGIFVLFYVQVVTYYLFGRGFADGLAEKRGGSTATTY